jgi:hypothetical protein
MVYSVFFSIFMIFFTCWLEAEVGLNDPGSRRPAQIEKKEKTSRPAALVEAQKAYDGGDFLKAEAMYWKNIEHLKMPDLRNLMRSSEKNKNYDESLKSANLILSQLENDEEALTFIGKYHSRRTSQKNSNQLAIDHFKRAIEANPKYQPAYEALIQHYENRMLEQEKLNQSKQKNYYELRILYQDMLMVFGERPEHLIALCKVNSLDAQLDQAQDICKRAINKDKNAVTAYVYLGKAYFQAQDEENAKKYLSIAAEKFKNSDIAQVAWGEFLESQKDFIRAYKAFNLGTQANPKSGAAWRGLGRAAVELNKNEEGFSAFKKACDLDPKSTAIDLRRAILGSKDKKIRFSSLAESCR